MKMHRSTITLIKWKIIVIFIIYKIIRDVYGTHAVVFYDTLGDNS